MEPDSTTYESNTKTLLNESCLPFATCPGNFKLYQELVHNDGEKNLESQIVERLQKFGLLQSSVKCPSNKPDCQVVCKSARVIDKVQWVCSGCQKKQPIRVQSFFFRLPCSLLQALQVILAWAEDADCYSVADFFGVKPKTAIQIYDRLDDLIVKEYDQCKLGGENSVVLAEMYPDCLNRLSPDTTDQSHVHRILMLADTNHIPTLFKLHVIREDVKKTFNDSAIDDSEMLKTEVEEAISRCVKPNSTIVLGSSLPAVSGATSIQHLLQYCDADMQHFLTGGVWRQALCVCGAAHEVCAAGGACGVRVRRYLRAAPPRLRPPALFPRILRALAKDLPTAAPAEL